MQSIFFIIATSLNFLINNICVVLHLHFKRLSSQSTTSFPPETVVRRANCDRPQAVSSCPVQGRRLEGESPFRGIRRAKQKTGLAANNTDLDRYNFKRFGWTRVESSVAWYQPPWRLFWNDPEVLPCIHRGGALVIDLPLLNKVAMTYYCVLWIRFCEHGWQLRWDPHSGRYSPIKLYALPGRGRLQLSSLCEKFDTEWYAVRHVALLQWCTCLTPTSNG